MASTIGASAAQIFNTARDARTPGRLRKLLQRLEPWYDRGTINTVRMDALTEDEATEGDVYRFEIQWFGIHLGLQFGRTPAKSGGRA